MASALLSDIPPAFSSVPIKPTKIARYLGIDVEVHSDIPFDGRYIPGGKTLEGTEAGTIQVRRGISPDRGRYIVAHELGHALLHRRGEAMSLSDEETFCIAFAHELLVPPVVRDEIKKLLRAARGIEDLIGISKKLGVYPGDLVNFAAHHSPWHGNELRAIIQIKPRAHTNKGSLVEWRVVASASNRNVLYVPKNKRLHSIAGYEGYRRLLSIRSRIFEIEINMLLPFRRSVDARWRDTQLLLRVRGMRLKSERGTGQQILLFLTDSF